VPLWLYKLSLNRRSAEKKSKSLLICDYKLYLHRATDEDSIANWRSRQQQVNPREQIYLNLIP
jgi:hypothetical protein